MPYLRFQMPQNQKPCRYCGHEFAHGTDDSYCPECGCMIGLPLNSIEVPKRNPNALGKTVKIIFLDIDGVLNNDNTPPYPKGWPESHIHDDLVAKVERLAQQSGAKIVMSTSWRAKFSAPEFQELLGKKGLTAEIIDCTPLKFSYRDRSGDIRDWLDDNAELGVEKFVALDDVQMYNMNGHLVLTDYHKGITDDDVEKALKILM